VPLMKAPVEETGLADFGSDPFAGALEVLVTATTHLGKPAPVRA
jgi:hypothetical protein